MLGPAIYASKDRLVLACEHSPGLEVRGNAVQAERGVGVKIKVRKLSIGRLFVPHPSSNPPIGGNGRPKSSQGQGLCISQFLFLLCCFRSDFLRTSLTRGIIRDEITSSQPQEAYAPAHLAIADLTQRRAAANHLSSSEPASISPSSLK